MNLYLFDEEEIIIFTLPTKKIGNFWMKDSNDKNTINIAAENNEWKLTPGKNIKISDSNGNSENISLRSKKYYLVEKNDRKYLLYCDYLSDNTYKTYSVKDGSIIKVGSSNICNICVPFSNIKSEHIILNYKDNKWTLNLVENSLCYINNKRVDKESALCNNCDLINIYGIKILLVNGCLFVNNPFNNITVNNMEQLDILIDEEMSNDEIEDEDLYKDEDYFLKSPRIRKDIITYEMNIDSPPAKEKVQDTPLWVTLAPMLTMAASSVVTLSNAISSVTSGERPLKSVLPSIIISISMILTMVVWPFITRKLEKRKKIKQEEERQDAYQKYIDKKDKELAVEYENQKRALEENIISTDICYDMITNKRRSLWSRRNDQDDFLTLRVGIGNVKFDTNINYHQEDFTMDNDNLKEMLSKLINYNKTIENVPISYSFTENILTCVNGIYPKYLSFINNLLLQAMAFHSYDDLKIVVFTNKKNKRRWEYLLDSPYCFSDDKTMRFFATNTEEMQEVSNNINQIFESRELLNKNGNSGERISDFSGFNNGYYLIIVDDIDQARKIDVVSNILKTKRNLGFSLLIVEERLSKVPSEVNKFIVIGEKTSTILDTSNNNQIKFNEEINDNYDMFKCTSILSNLPIRTEKMEKQLPISVSFLELFGVGKIEQLNVLNRWKENNPTKSLKTEIGVNTIGDPFIIDLHEKQHGPHGLIAGMTGSGKSEFIISLVLSLAVNYSPEEVAFVLIDYKGGGLAGAFVDNETGKKLPHVVGTITNLDKTEINRSLASINSELRRRQEIFNKVREQTGEGTVDIYKYQRLYRDGILKEPMPHLIIVCDEFAELKSQQPDFMNDLISTARIGRSLGIHLILATQKPSGVVDGQIWSNAKFKICLKVQDKQDSMEMIRNDLAAELKNVGRFYLMVGYDEYFAIGQAAWAGAQYFPNTEFKKNVDKNLYLIDNVGSISKTITNSIAKKSIVSKGEELTHIVKYLIDIGKEATLNVKQLWLDRIPNEIFIDKLQEKYKYKVEKFVINPIIGEYDNPKLQEQGLLSINFNECGNTLVYGMNESGKDEFLQTMIYSILNNHSTDEVNLYILDFGAETLINYSDAPQVGDVMINGDDEKINNLVKLLSFEMNKRKKLFTSFGGNYDSYIQKSNQTLPNIVVVINSIEILSELYSNVVDGLASIIRDGSKYGIYFVITTETQNSVKIKIVQSCKNSICLQLTNEISYKDILGKTNGLIPTPVFGRGLVKVNSVCEFQTAYISSQKNSYESIINFVKELSSKGYSKATKIHVMPEIIELSAFKEVYTGLDKVPIGVAKDNLNSYLYDFKRKVTNIISATEFDFMNKFIKNIIRVLFLNKKDKLLIIDCQNVFEKNDYKNIYFNDNFASVVDMMERHDDIIQKELQKNNMNYRTIENYANVAVCILGFDKFYQKLDDEHKTKFKKIMENNKEHAKINFILFDIPSGYKKYEYEEWYKNYFDPNNGLWIGSGLSQQFILKTTTQNAIHSLIDNAHAIVIKNGLPLIIKTINEIK